MNDNQNQTRYLGVLTAIIGLFVVPFALALLFVLCGAAGFAWHWMIAMLRGS